MMVEVLEMKEMATIEVMMTMEAMEVDVGLVTTMATMLQVAMEVMEVDVGLVTIMATMLQVAMEVLEAIHLIPQVVMQVLEVTMGGMQITHSLMDKDGMCYLLITMRDMAQSIVIAM